MDHLGIMNSVIMELMAPIHMANGLYLLNQFYILVTDNRLI